ncbi:hypothetical protein GCM10010954_13340 [Halobacillus andaensis]|uniref:Uncharacterized protein n=1 Tax=Halobacillus andaensis TaxID=1176239 RepID=A0A917EU20_HALAA|nr:hypothetical protein [Halobacillus andaensis]GGF16061.1 hypothetical protein GCM10010954_13340 [Halobacillus andaensis]
MIVRNTRDCFSLDIFVFKHKECVRELNMKRTMSPYMTNNIATIVKTSFIPYETTLSNILRIEQKKTLNKNTGLTFMSSVFLDFLIAYQYIITILGIFDYTLTRRSNKLI